MRTRRVPLASGPPANARARYALQFWALCPNGAVAFFARRRSLAEQAYIDAAVLVHRSVPWWSRPVPWSLPQRQQCTCHLRNIHMLCRLFELTLLRGCAVAAVLLPLIVRICSCALLWPCSRASARSTMRYAAQRKGTQSIAQRLPSCKSMQQAAWVLNFICAFMGAR